MQLLQNMKLIYKNSKIYLDILTARFLPVPLLDMMKHQKTFGGVDTGVSDGVWIQAEP